MDIKHLGYSPKQLSKLLPLSEQTLARDRKNGHIGLPFIKSGRKIVYPAYAIEAWLKSVSFSPSAPKTNETSKSEATLKRPRGRPVGTTKVELEKRRSKKSFQHDVVGYKQGNSPPPNSKTLRLNVCELGGLDEYM